MAQAYQLKIQLKDFRPSTYRTLLIDPQETFFDVHCRIQDMFGLYDGHLWNFVHFDRKWWHITDITYEIQELDDWLDFDNTRENNPAEKMTLEHFFSRYPRIMYTYDFWDNWEFDITLEKTIETNHALPKILRGKWGMIIENIGWVWWLEEYYEAYGEKKAPEDWEYSYQYNDSIEEWEEKPDLWENFREFMETDILSAWTLDEIEWSKPREVWRSLYIPRIKDMKRKSL